VIVASDHGEAFGEHGHLAHCPTLHEEVIRLPLIIDHPDASPRTVTAPTSLSVISPTVRRAMGVEPPSAFRERSVLDVVTGEPPTTRSPVTSIALRGETVTEQLIPRQLGERDLIVRARTDRWAYELDSASGEDTLCGRTDSGEQGVRLEAAPEAALT
jgi:arylsulfatase A-like enzyme